LRSPGIAIRAARRQRIVRVGDDSRAQWYGVTFETVGESVPVEVLVTVQDSLEHVLVVEAGHACFNAINGSYIRVAPSGGIQWGRLLLSLVGDTVRQAWISMTGAARIIGGLPRIMPGDLALLKGLIEAAELRTVIDRRYSIDEIGEAFRYAEGGHKKGHVLIVFE
jgi:hypothetical protein